MHQAAYDADSAAVVEVADALRFAVVEWLESWEDDADAGDADARPVEDRESLRLFALAVEATRLARDLSDHRSVATTLAAEAA
jgi:hypothetical protein